MKPNRQPEYPQAKAEPHPIILIVAYFSLWLMGLAVYVMGSMT